MDAQRIENAEVLLMSSLYSGAMHDEMAEASNEALNALAEDLADASITKIEYFPAGDFVDGQRPNLAEMRNTLIEEYRAALMAAG
jgi:hypothetical protein